MPSNLVVAAVIVAILYAATLTAVRADFPVHPGNQTVEYRIRETPTDPDSLVVFVIIMELAPSDSDGNEIGWEITEMEFHQTHRFESECTIWVEESPMVPSADGLWWIEHQDPENPELSEFVMPPLLEGTADAQDPSNPDLHYRLEGVTYAPPPPPGRQPFDITAALDYQFTLVGEQDPFEEGKEEPVEVDDIHDPH